MIKNLYTYGNSPYYKALLSIPRKCIIAKGYVFHD